MGPNTLPSLKGHLLVATPQLSDPNFHRTVLLMLDHSPEGAAAVVLNRPTGASISQVVERIFEESTDWPKHLHVGGPVPGPLLALHTRPDLSDKPVFDGLFSTFDPDQIRQILRERPEPCLFLANYAGWGPGQLESELADDSWCHTSATVELVFASAHAGSWEPVLETIRSERILRALEIREVPADPSMN